MNNRNFGPSTWEEKAKEFQQEIEGKIPPKPMVSYKKEPTVQERIEKRIAEKDANFYVLNASNVAGEIVAALIKIGEPCALEPIKKFEELRNEIIKSNISKSRELQ